MIQELKLTVLTIPTLSAGVIPSLTNTFENRKADGFKYNKFIMSNMDLLGKQGEQASERLNNVEEKIQQIDSHLSAVDNALQDFVDNYSKLLEGELDQHDSEINQLWDAIEDTSDNEETTERLERRLKKIEKRLDNHDKKMKNLIGLDLKKFFSEITGGVKSAKKTVKDTEKDLTDLEQRVEDMESELVVEINNRDFDFEKKLDKREYESREEKLEEQVRKLRTSVRFLADELDKEDEIEIE
jgi:chromosome segregation ATPase